jgi:hypothetical protein
VGKMGGMTKEIDSLNLNLRIIEWQKIVASINTLNFMTYSDAYNMSKFKSLSQEFINRVEDEDLWGG